MINNFLSYVDYLRNWFSPRTNRTLAAYILIGVILFLWTATYLALPWFQSFFFLMILVCGLLFLIRPHWAIIALAFEIALSENRLGFYFKAENIGMRNNKTIPFFLIFLILAVIAWYFHKTAKIDERPLRKNPLPLAAVLLFILYAFLSLQWTPRHNYGLVVFFLFLIPNIIGYYLTIALVREENAHRQIMWVWVFTGLINAALTMLSIYDIPRQVFLYKYLFSDKVLVIFNNTEDVVTRGYALGHPNHTVMVINMSIFITIGLLLVEKSFRKRLFLGGSLVIMVFAAILTESKAGVGSLFLSFLFLVIFAPPMRKRWFKTISICLIVFFFLFFISIFYNYSERRGVRILKTSVRNQSSLTIREKIWKSGWKQMKRRHDVLSGLGVGGMDLTSGYPHANNHILSFVFDFGIAGVIFVFILYGSFAAFFLKFLKTFRKPEGYLQIMSLVIIAGTLAVAIHGTMEHYYWKFVIWLYLGLATATLNLLYEKDNSSYQTLKT